MSVQIRELRRGLSDLRESVGGLAKEMYKIADVLVVGRSIAITHGYTMNMSSELDADSGLPTCADDYTYRVEINRDRVNIICFGLPTVDANCEGEYDSVDALPNWVQERLAILMMTPNTKPTRDIPKIGRRVSGNVFWVYAPEPSSEDKSRG